MKLFKSLLLGSAAGLVAAAAAQAADLPSRKAAPAEFVKICDAYGAGFFYIPGTDTCLKVGGYVRAEYSYFQPLAAFGVTSPSTSTTTTTTGKVFVPASQQDTTGFMERGRVELDARTQTPWGTARTFIGVRAQNASGPYSGGDTTYGTGLSVAYTGKAGGAAITLENAIVQFAGFTFGHTTADIASFIPAEYYMPMFNYGSPAGFNLLAYTATLGGGLSATIGVEDKQSMGWNTPGSPTVIGGGTVTTVLGPYTWPALQANIRLDQPWGSAQLSGGVIDNSVLVNGPATGASPSAAFVKDSVGWGVTAGVRINLPMMGPGDHLLLNAGYASGYLDLIGSANTSILSGDDGRLFGGLLRMDSNAWTKLNAGCAVGSTSPGCYGLSNTTGWSVEGFYDHYWSPTLRSVLMVGYEDITPPSSVRNTDWTAGGLSEVKIFRVSLQPVVWNPVAGLELGGEISYGHLDQTLAHAPGVAASALLTGYPSAKSDAWQGRLRVTRQF